jgi:hypothetical protein
MKEGEIREVQTPAGSIKLMLTSDGKLLPTSITHNFSPESDIAKRIIDYINKNFKVLIAKNGGKTFANYNELLAFDKAHPKEIDAMFRINFESNGFASGRFFEETTIPFDKYNTITNDQVLDQINEFAVNRGKVVVITTDTNGNKQYQVNLQSGESVQSFYELSEAVNGNGGQEIEFLI